MAIMAVPAVLPASAQGLLDRTGKKAGFSTETGTGEATALPALIVGRVIRVVLGLLGVVFLVLLIYGGFLWMTSSGNEDQLGKSKKIIKNATIGLVIILGAEIVTYFVIDRLLKAMGS